MISVIVPVYQDVPGLTTTIKSLLKQDFTDYEITTFFFIDLPITSYLHTSLTWFLLIVLSFAYPTI